MKVFYLIVCMTLLFSCSEKPTALAPDAYRKFLSSSESGIVKVIKQDGLEFKMQLVPPQYAAYIESGRQLSDSLVYKKVLSEKAKYMTFRLSISQLNEEGEKAENRVLWKEVGKYEEYKKRIESMNFYIKDYFELVADGKTFVPAISNLENTYGLSESLNITLVFVPESDADKEVLYSNDLDIIWNDVEFKSGIHHFKFDKEHIQNIPDLNI